MVIQEMTNSECLSALAGARLGRLACTHENQPYVVPIYFVYEDPYLYGFTTPGLKVEWMRAIPSCASNWTQWRTLSSGRASSYSESTRSWRATPEGPGAAARA